MGVVNDRGRYYWVKRIPKRYQGLVQGKDGKPVTQVRQALFTDSKKEALAKAAQVEVARMAEWEALAAGNSGSARKHYQAAKRLAEARGFQYQALADIIAGPLDDLLPRLAELGTPDAPAPPAVVEAVFGVVPKAMPTIREMLVDYLDLTTSRHILKSDIQKRRWLHSRTRAVNNFCEVVYPDGPLPPVDEITRADALKFRNWWSGRVEGGMSANSANKQIGHLSEMFTTWADLNQPDLPNPFRRLSLSIIKQSRKPAFSRAWITGKLLAPGAFDGLNEEARLILMVMINTGIRPSEVIDAPLGDLMINHDIPHLRIAANGRELKVQHTERDIPLLGVSLDAAKQLVERGGVVQYAQKSSNWSALINKFMRHNGLAETPQHTAYSLRHYVEDALLNAGIDDRIRADILGHKYARPNYGEGGGLLGRQRALAKIALL